MVDYAEGWNVLYKCKAAGTEWGGREKNWEEFTVKKKDKPGGGSRKLWNGF